MSTSGGSSSPCVTTTRLSPIPPLAIDLADLTLSVIMRIIGKLSCEKHKLGGSSKSLDISIQAFHVAMDLTEDDDPDKVNILSELAEVLHTRFKCAGESRDLEEAIELQQLVDAITPDDFSEKSNRLNNLAVYLYSRHEQEGRWEDLEDAIALQTRAVELSSGDGSASPPEMLNNLGSLLLVRFKRSGSFNDLERAISLLTRVVEFTPDDPHDKAAWLNNLGNALESRFKLLGNFTDLEDAISMKIRSVELTPDEDPSKPVYLDNAGNTLHARFRQLGNLEDLERAVAFQECAVELLSDSSSNKPSMLNNLANSLEARYERTKDPNDLQWALEHSTRAIELAPDNHPVKPGYLNNLGFKLHARFEQSGDLDDLGKAVGYLTRAVELTPEGHPDRLSRVQNLGIMLQCRFERIGDVEDLDRAVGCAQQLVKLSAGNRPDRAHGLQLLGQFLTMRLRSPYAHEDDATRATEAYLEAAENSLSPPIQRLKAYVQYARLLADFSHLFTSPHRLTSLQAYERVLDLIPQCIWLGNTVRSRYTGQDLEVVSKAVSDAVAAAIAAREYIKAVEWFEAGRSIIWSQVLQLFTPLEDLRRAHPALADELDRVSHALYRSGAADASSAPLQVHRIQLPLGLPLQNSHSLALQYDNLVEQIRKLEGFENFLRPKTFAQLSLACADGPVVIVHVHELHCDALVLHSAGKVEHIPLPNFSYDNAESLKTRLWTCLRSRGLMDPTGDSRGVEDVEERGEAGSDDLEGADQLCEILGDLWTAVVQPIMQVVLDITQLSIRPESTLPHVTWCPTGPLVFLPIHAAGIYHKDGSPSSPHTVMDLAVSSYTPTLEALLRPRRKSVSTSADTRDPKILVVSQHSAEAGTTEAEVLTSLFGDRSAVKVLDGADGTVDAVIEDMTSHGWVHLACNINRDHEDPTNGSFTLSDGNLTLSTLISKHLPLAELAVLSVNGTGTACGDERLPEEAAHFVAGMLNVGYRSVVGTMWAVDKSTSGVNMMKEFYEKLAAQMKAGGEVRPAYALYEATKTYREKCGATDVMRWVPYVHFGL